MYLSSQLGICFITQHRWYTKMHILFYSKHSQDCETREYRSYYGIDGVLTQEVGGSVVYLFIYIYFLLEGGRELFRNRNSWNDQNNSSFSDLSWLQTCQNQLTVSLWRFYSHSGMRVAWERTIVWLIPTIPNQNRPLIRKRALTFTPFFFW